MTLWQELSSHEKTAIRKLALGYADVPRYVLRRLVTLGLVEQGPHRPRLTESGVKLHRSDPRVHGRRQKRDT